MAEVAIPETLFADIPRLIAELRPPPICFVSVMRSAVLRPLTLTAKVRLDEGKASVCQHKTGWWLEIRRIRFYLGNVGQSECA